LKVEVGSLRNQRKYLLVIPREGVESVVAEAEPDGDRA
jgi:hypothetical protein